jgi:hypothetical protein
MLRFADASGTVVAKANDPEHARRLAVCLNAFLQAETTDIERIAMRRLRRSYWKKQLLRKLLSALDRLGCFSFLSALASICRIRSRVSENCWPTSSSVWSAFMPMPKRMRTMRSSRGVSEAISRGDCSPPPISYGPTAPCGLTGTPSPGRRSSRCARWRPSSRPSTPSWLPTTRGGSSQRRVTTKRAARSSSPRTRGSLGFCHYPAQRTSPLSRRDPLLF